MANNNVSQAADMGVQGAQERGKTGLKIARYFTRPGVHPYDERRDS